jgi:uncharacterized protein (DUF697 family)
MFLSAGAGLIPVPWVDLAAVAGVQLKMLAEISSIYEVPFEENRGKAAIAALGGFIVPHAAAWGYLRDWLKAVPIIGPLMGAPAMAVFSGAWAWAVGNLFIQHFESGGTFLNFKAEQVKEYFKAQFELGRKLMTNPGANAA